MCLRRLLSSIALIAPALIVNMATPAAAQERCGEVVTLQTRGQSLAYSLATPAAGDAAARGALVLLPGGGGFIDLGPDGCARQLAGNSLIRSLPLFHKDGYVTALVDAPSDWRGQDGLGGFRNAPEHAADIGRVVADLRRRTGLPVYLVGTSRGSISAVNAASRLSGDAAPDAAPDGIVLTSPVTSGQQGARKAWVAQSVFDLDLAAIRVPVLVVAHAADTCVRTPPRLAPDILERTEGAREQFVAVEGGPAADTVYPGLEACEGRAPHGFVGQEADVAAGMARFLGGGAY
jgi:hypothetical protein